MSDSVSTSLEAIVESMGGQSRVGQREMAKAVMEAFSAGDNVIVQAGTGTGKSLAYLVPAARLARENGPVAVSYTHLTLPTTTIV